jgi:hypothetical protein
VTLRVQDALTAYPRDITVINAQSGESVRRKVTLFTHSSEGDVADPELRVSDPRWIQASISRKTTSDMDVFPEKFAPRFEIEATMIPSEGTSSVTGKIEVLNNDQILLTIPITFSLKRNYRLSQDSVEFDGAPGETVSRDVFYESYAIGWRDLDVASVPDGVVLKIEPFDARTRVIRLRGRIAVEGHQEDTAVVLVTRDHNNSIRIPVSFVPKRVENSW